MMEKFGLTFLAGMALILSCSFTFVSSLRCYTCGGLAVLNFQDDQKGRSLVIGSSDDAKKYDLAMRNPCKGNSRGVEVDCSKIFQPSQSSNQRQSKEEIKATLFSDIFFSGSSKEVIVNGCQRIPSEFSFSFSNHFVSSVRVEGRGCIKLWEESDCRGRSVVARGSDKFDLDLDNFDNKASSFSDCDYEFLACVELRTINGDFGRDCAGALVDGEGSKMTGKGSQIHYCFSNNCNFGNVPPDSKLITSKDPLRIRPGIRVRSGGHRRCYISDCGLLVLIGFSLLHIFPHFY